MSTELIVDARGLAPPEPMEKALAALTQLERGARLRLLIHREPMPLYRILQNNGYRWRTLPQDDGTYEITIWEPAID